MTIARMQELAETSPDPEILDIIGDYCDLKMQAVKYDAIIHRLVKALEKRFAPEEINAIMGQGEQNG